jgi:CRP-like cAMP-binding protein
MDERNRGPSVLDFGIMISPDTCLTVRQCALFTDLNESACQTIIQAGRSYTLPQGAFFFHQGDESRMLYVIVEGRVKLTKVTADGQQVIVNVFGPGEGLGIIVALNQTPYPVSAEVVEECTAVGWERDLIIELMSQNAQLALNGMALVGKRFTQMQSQFEELATQRVEQRVARTILRLVRQFGRRTDEGVLIDMSLTREDIAQMAGTNLYQVSRILSRWEQAGYIATARRQVTLCKAHEIVAIAEDLPGQPGTPAL